MTIYYVGTHYEWTGSASTMVKYDYAGGQRVAMRQGSSTLYFLLGDHPSLCSGKAWAAHQPLSTQRQQNRRTVL
ncbi:MAG TPA: hypothetical protein PLJ78_14540 [Anaerolineae bacterium]|nr:hypothetical protein [Anaerolineae bacterium]HQK15150.1 hypothetical protein [Anaerolineae bacterium]